MMRPLLHSRPGCLLLQVLAGLLLALLLTSCAPQPRPNDQVQPRPTVAQQALAWARELAPDVLRWLADLIEQPQPANQSGQSIQSK